MMRTFTAISAVALLTACGDGEPLFEDVIENATDEVEAELPPGTENASADGSIFRYEERNEKGGGLFQRVEFNDDDDTFVVDNLGFDGANVYQEDGDQNGYTRYVADFVVPDSLTGASVDQIVPYYAITGRSDTLVGDPDDPIPQATFAIVRTGGYFPYGFGSYTYERRGSVTLPSSGQAQWEGTYAGIRVYDPFAQHDLTEGDARISIDFEDFNSNDAVAGLLSNRTGVDQDGDQMPLEVGGQLLLPDLRFVIQEGLPSILETGELTGELQNFRINENGIPEIYENGRYNAMIVGDATAGDGGQLVGIFVVESEDPRQKGLMVQETGGFILDRAGIDD